MSMHPYIERIPLPDPRDVRPDHLRYEHELNRHGVTADSLGMHAARIRRLLGEAKGSRLEKALPQDVVALLQLKPGATPEIDELHFLPSVEAAACYAQGVDDGVSFIQLRVVEANNFMTPSQDRKSLGISVASRHKIFGERYLVHAHPMNKGAYLVRVSGGTCTLIELNVPRDTYRYFYESEVAASFEK